MQPSRINAIVDDRAIDGSIGVDADYRDSRIQQQSNAAIITLMCRAGRLASVMSLLAVVACSSPPAAPTSTASVATPITGLTIVGMPLTPHIGDRAQLTAKVVFSNGGQKILADAAWGSSDPAVAAVSHDGLLTVVGAGATDISATGADHTTSAHMRVFFVLSGTVHETFPTEDTPIAHARGVVQDGSNAGAIVETDAVGHFQLEVESAGFHLAINADGYDPATVDIQQLPRDDHPSIGLRPNGRTFEEFSGNLCTSVFPQPSGECGQQQPAYPFETTHTFAVHRAGRVMAEVNYQYTGDYYPNSLDVEVRCGSSIIAKKRAYYYGYGSTGATRPVILPDNIAGAVPLDAPEACELQVRLFNFIADTKGGLVTSYRVSIDHPR